MARKESKNLCDLETLTTLQEAGDAPELITMRLRPSVLIQIEKLIQTLPREGGRKGRSRVAILEHLVREASERHT